MAAVMAPGSMPTFPGICTPDDLLQAMKDRPDWVLANLAHIAYRAPSTITTRCLTMGALDVRVRQKKQAVGFVAKFKTFTVVSFRGTVSVVASDKPSQLHVDNGKLELKKGKDATKMAKKLVFNSIMADLNFAKTVFEGVKVHQGFLRELLLVWHMIAEDLEELAGDDPVFATGHSLGGAMATLSSHFYEYDRLVTFGEPRVGHRLHRLLKVPAERHIRYVNGNDPVPDLPPSFLMFEHHGLLRWLHHPLGPNPLLDHSIVGYVDHLL